MKENRNLDLEEIVIQIGRLRRWMPTKAFRYMLDRLISRGRFDDGALKIIREEKSKQVKKK